jgi:hypothetical protein
MDNDPTGLWLNNCDATPHVQEADEDEEPVVIYGGENECGIGHDIWRVFDDSEMCESTEHIHFTGTIHTMGSWDAENSFTVSMVDQYQRVLDTKTFNANEDGEQFVHLHSVYSPSFNGDVTVRITNNLDQAVNEESIGYSNLRFGFEYDPEETESEPEAPAEFPSRSPGDYDWDKSDPTSLWSNNCEATKRECAGFNYYGGAGQCGKDHRFFRTFNQDKMHPGTNKVIFKAKIWTIDSWDNEEITIKMVDEDGDVMAEKVI